MTEKIIATCNWGCGVFDHFIVSGSKLFFIHLSEQPYVYQVKSKVDLNILLMGTPELRNKVQTEIQELGIVLLEK